MPAGRITPERPPPARPAARSPAARSSATRPPGRRGFGLLELTTAVALLVILLGLAVSLARFVRATAAEQITRQTLGRLEVALQQPGPPTTRPGDEAADPAPPVPAEADEAQWAEFARRSNRTVAALAGVDETVADAWGNPIGYLDTALDGGRHAIGMAPHDRPFCFSAGPDGRYLTQDDNLYSYEQLLPIHPSTAPTAGGHGE